MATAQTLALTCTSSKPFRDPHTAPLSEQYSCTMGSVGSLTEKPDILPDRLKSKHSRTHAGVHQHEGLVKKGLAQQELLNHFNSRIEPNSNKPAIADLSPFKREHDIEDENVYSKVYHKNDKNHKKVHMSLNSPPTGGKFKKSQLRPLAFNLVSNKNFSSMQNLYTGRAEELDGNLANGLHMSYAKVAPTTPSSSSLSPSHPGHGSRKTKCYQSQDDESMSDSGHNSINSLPLYQPRLSQISASVGHINHIGSLDRVALRFRGGTSNATDTPSQSAATQSWLRDYGSEAPPPYELSQSLEDVVQDLEDQLLEKEHEFKQMRKNLDESEDAVSQVFERKQRLWEKEVEELKRLYATKLRQVSQYAQRSQRSLQLQLYKVQQERQHLQEDLKALQSECQILKGRHVSSSDQEHEIQLEETQWEVCQKSGEISLLKQQLRDSQAEVAQKLSEIFHLKTKLREMHGKMRSKDNQIDMLQQALHQVSHHPSDKIPEALEGSRGPTPGGPEDRLRAELMLERRQSEAQASSFEAERRIWQIEKEKVIRYQKELQASYLEMYHRNQVLEKELLQLRGGGGRDQGFIIEDRLPSGLPWIDRIESSEI
ncbi:hypothetical protein GN956_G7459 [Arapaima gigas]